jgi:hypothetical protein
MKLPDARLHSNPYKEISPDRRRGRHRGDSGVGLMICHHSDDRTEDNDVNLRELVDRAKIEELIHLYALYLDTFQLEALVGLFTTDATFDETVVLGGMPVTGADDILRFYQSGVARMASMVHVTCNFVLQSLTNTTASAVSTMQFEGVTKFKEVIKLQGYWLDDFRRVDNRWKIYSRRLVLLAPQKSEPVSS